MSGGKFTEEFGDNKMIKLYQGDCLDVLKGIPSGSIDLNCKDPP